MKTNRLSHSAVSRYQSCPKSYAYHYQDRYRSKYSSAALFFGSAVDSAINNLLKPDGKDPYDSFDYNWKFARIDGQEDKEFLTNSNKIVYSNTDFDRDLITDEDIDQLKEKTGLSNREEVLEYYKTLVEAKKTVSWDKLSDDDKRMYNSYNWISLRRKGHLMIKAYEDEIMPNIVKVHDVQRFIKLQNDTGDSIIGYIDLIADIKHNGVVKTVILDLKTSTIDYEEDAVLTSPQLTLYKNAVGDEFKTDMAGFIILKKQVIKNRKKICSKCGNNGSGGRHKTCDSTHDVTGIRCHGNWDETIDPKIDIQILIDSIPKRTEEIVIENFEQINNSIKNGNFPRNFSSCVKPWGKCEFFKLCYKNDDSDLIKLADKKR